MSSKISGWSLEISFRLLATLLLTISEESFFKFSSMGKLGFGSFFRAGIAIAQGRRGRLPSLASLLTCGFLCCDHFTISATILFPYLMIKGRTANSQLINWVMDSKASTEDLKSSNPYV